VNADICTWTIDTGAVSAEEAQAAFLGDRKSLPSKDWYSYDSKTVILLLKADINTSSYYSSNRCVFLIQLITFHNYRYPTLL
jgi:hypothetical protein